MEEENIQKESVGSPILRVEKLRKEFNKVIAVKDVDFEVYEGEVLGIIGSNGSGKTTLFNLISGVLKPTSGKIFAPPKSEPSHLSRVLESAKSNYLVLLTLPLYLLLILFSLPFTILNYLTSLLHEKKELNGRKSENIVGYSPDKILNRFGIVRTFQIVKPFKYMTSLENVTVPYVPQLPISKSSTLKTRAMRSLLSVDLGEKQKYPAVILPHGDLKRLDFARAMATNPKILLLDEPFGGLSAEDAFRVTQLIKTANREYGVTIIVVEHKLKLLANLVSRIIVLDHGVVIASGTPKEISQNKRVITAYLGMEAADIA
jgi:branched-chain amino acid transport system ATP-binding protein